MLKKFLFWILFLPFFSFAWTYPLKEVSKPVASCKYAPWSTLWPSCKIPLPILKPQDYEKYKSDLTYRRIYTVLWASSYKYGWDQWYWTHEWVDIATSLWTPVYSIWDGKVISASYKKGRWNVIVIQYKVNWRYIYANYAHLNKILVRAGEYVKYWQKIWEVGHSWFSIWNHLHFQIDTKESVYHHPFWFGSCSYWHSIIDIVNNTFCLSDLKANTVDPLKFLATNWAIISQIVSKPSSNQPQKISRQHMISLEEIRRQMIQDFLRTHKFSFHFSNAGVYYLGKYWEFTISLKDRRWRTYSDILPWDLKIVYDTKYFSSFYPRTLKILDWTRKVTFLPKKTWTLFLTFKLWDFTIYQKSIRIIKPGQTITPSYSNIITIPRKPYVGYPSRWINIFQDKNYINIINVPFNWTYYLSSSTNDVVFCKAPTNLKYLNFFQCSAENMSRIMKFTYKDTIFGLFVFKFFSNSWKPTKLLIKNSKWKLISQTNTIYFSPIKLTNYRSEYSSDVKSACEKWLCLNLIDKWYIWVDKDLSVYGMKNLFRNMLLLLWKKVKINTTLSDKYKFVSREEFVEDLFKLMKISIKDYNQLPKYIDVRNKPKNFQNIVIYLTKLWFKWKDRFADYHFQPDKNITVWEALYLTNFLLSKYK